jgi:hypothetical protein
VATPLSPGAERWELAMHLLTPLRPNFNSPTPAGVALKQALAEAVADGALQTRPHILLLEKEYYTQKLKQRFADWLFEWLAPRANVGSELYGGYLRRRQRPSVAVTPLGMQLLNLSFDWLDVLLPHVLGKVGGDATLWLMSPSGTTSGLALWRGRGGFRKIAGFERLNRPGRA